MICDEAHRLKTKTLNITKKAILGIPTRRRLLLSGTPIQNNLDELYDLLLSSNKFLLFSCYGCLRLQLLLLLHFLQKIWM